MTEMIQRWTENVHRYGFYKEQIINGCVHFYNDKADFESEAEYNREMSAQIAFNDNHKRGDLT